MPLSNIAWADRLQFTIMAVPAVSIALLTLTHASRGPLPTATPKGWNNPFFGLRHNLDRTGIITEVDAKISYAGHGLFGISVMMLLFSGYLKKAAGPAPNYDMQNFLAMRSPKDGAMLSGSFSVALLPIRYLMISGGVMFMMNFFYQVHRVMPFGFPLPSGSLDSAAFIAMGLILVSGFILKKTWLDNIRDWPEKEIALEKQKMLAA